MSNENEKPVCELCDDADACWVVLVDTGDHINDSGWSEAGAAYMVACDGCKDTGYMDPEPLTPAWVKYLAKPWLFYDAPHGR